LFYNPEGNLYLASNTLLQQLESYISELTNDQREKFEDSVSFKLVNNLVQSVIGASFENKHQLFYQFKVTRIRQGEPSLDGEDFLVSKILESNK
jgi:hypothetical protein